jgi:long-subunit fatty acid transport protein
MSAIRLCTFFIVIVATLLSGSPSYAGGPTMTSFGARRNGSLANLAFLDDGEALFFNPAGLARYNRLQVHISLGAALIKNKMELKALDANRFPAINPKGCGEAGKDPCPWPIAPDGYYEQEITPERVFGVLPAIALSWALDPKLPDIERIVLGFGIHTPNLYGAFLPKDAPSAYFVTDGYFIVVAATLGMGVRFNEHLSIGVSLAYNYMALAMGRKLSIPDVLTGPGEDVSSLGHTGYALLGDLMLDYTGTDHGLGWTLGVMIDPTSWMTIGAAYNGSTAARFRGPVSFTSVGAMVDDPQFLAAALSDFGYKMPTDLEVEMTLPHSLQFGIGLKPAPWIDIAIDCRLWFYNFHDTQRLSPVYDPDQPGDEPLTAENLSRDKGYHMSYQVGVGVMVRPLTSLPGLELMTGFAYDLAPAPEETLTLDSPALAQYRLAAGVRYAINDSWNIAATYTINLYQDLNITTSETSPPTNLRGTSYSHFPMLQLHYRHN